MLGYEHGSRAFVGPTTVQVDLTDACNQNCQVCWLHAPDLEERNAQRLARADSLPWDLFLRLLDELAALGTEEIYFAGGGEPLLHPRVWDALEASVHRGFTTSLHTNFSRVVPKDVDRILDLGIHYVTVSLWAGTRAAYGRTHPLTDPRVFDRITTRVEALNAKKRDRPQTKLYNVLTRDNWDEVPYMLELAERCGCDNVEFAVADIVPGGTEAYALGPEAAGAILEQLKDLAARPLFQRPRVLGLSALQARLQALAQGLASDCQLVHDQPCFAGWNYARVLASGQVIPCLKAHRIPTGSLHEQSFASLWNSEAQRQFRVATRVVHKGHPLLAEIGNDPERACGCEGGCDKDNERHQIDYNYFTEGSRSFQLIDLGIVVGNYMRFI